MRSLRNLHVGQLVMLWVAALGLIAWFFGAWALNLATTDIPWVLLVSMFLIPPLIAVVLFVFTWRWFALENDEPWRIR